MHSILVKPFVCLCLLCCITKQAAAQKGYVYVHVKALNEESSPNASAADGFPFALANTGGAIASFTLNDQPDYFDLSDIGSGHGASATGGGDGELWAIQSASGTLFNRKSGSAAWTTTNTSGAVRVDGAGPGQYVFINNAGFAFFFNGTSTFTIYTPAAHNNVKATDIAFGKNLVAITGSDGSVLTNTALTTDNWNTVLPAATGAKRIDIQPSTGQLLYLAGDNSVIVATTTGALVKNYGNPGAKDIAFDDNGNLYASPSAYWNGSSWAESPGSDAGSITGGAGGQVWGLSTSGLGAAKTIITRTYNGRWLTDERARTTFYDNSVMVAVAAGVYTLSGAIPGGWDVTGLEIYDPTGNTTKLSKSALSVNVAAGEVVHVVVQVEKLNPAKMKQVCVEQVIEDFGTGPTQPVTFTSYHYLTNIRTNDGYYSIGKESTGWGTALTDHTTGTGNFIMFNASFQADEFFRKRITDLTPGFKYTMSFWAAILNGGIRPNVLAGMADEDGTVLQTLNTGAITSATWKQYSFVFTAQTTTADFFLQNNANGGGGNDIAIDDIALNPYIPSGGINSVDGAVTNADRVTFCKSSGIHDFSNSMGGGTWSSSNAGVAAIDATGHLTVVGMGSTNITYTIPGAFGCDGVAVTPVVVGSNPTVAVTAGPSPLCLGSTVQLSAKATGGTPPYNYSWTVRPLAGASGLDTMRNAAATAVPAATGDYVYHALVTDVYGCSMKDSAAPVKVVDAGLPAAINYAQNPYCPSGNAIVTQTGPAGGSYLSTANLLIDAATGTVQLDQLPAGSYPVYYYYSGNNCQASVQTRLIISPLPVAAAGPDQTQYGNTTFTMTASTPGTGNTGLWSVVSGTADIADRAQPNTTIILPPKSSATLSWTVTGPCGSSTDRVVLNAKPMIPPLLMEKLLVTRPPYAIGNTIRYLLKVTNTGTETVSPVNVTDLLPPVTKTGNLVLTQVPAGSTAVYDGTTNSIQWNIDVLGAGASLELGYDLTLKDSGTIVNTAIARGSDPEAALPDTAVASFTYLLNADLRIQKRLNTTGPVAVGDKVSFTITVTNDGPIHATDVQVTDPLANNLGTPDSVLTSTGYAVYNAPVNSLVWFVGSLAAGATDSLRFTARIISGGSLENTVTVSGKEPDANRGNNTASIVPVPIVGNKIFIPNSITPNGDGKNDRWIIPGLSQYPGAALSIFNRWGNQVYQTSNYNNNWSGEGLSGGAYFYVLQLKTPQGIQMYKGWIELIR